METTILNANINSHDKSLQAVIEAWKYIYNKVKEENEALRAENEQLKAERDNALRNIERLSALEWNRPVGF